MPDDLELLSHHDLMELCRKRKKQAMKWKERCDTALRALINLAEGRNSIEELREMARNAGLLPPEDCDANG